MAYFINLFSPETYEAFARASRDVSGVRLHHKRMAERVSPGDTFGIGRRESSNGHDNERFDKECVCVDFLPSTPPFDWWWRGYGLDEPE